MLKLSSIWSKYQNTPVRLRASIWFLVCSFLQRGISVITTPIFTRLLSPTEYGNYNVFNSWLGIVTIFVSLRLYFGVYTQGLVKFEEDRPQFSSSMQGLSTALVLVWTVVYLMFQSFWNTLFGLTTVQMLAMLTMIWATAVFNFWAAEKRVTCEYRELVLLTLLVSIAKPLIGILFVIQANDKVTARILGLAIVEMVFYCGLFFQQMRRGKKFFSAKYWKYALLFNIPLIPHYLSQTVLNSADRIMIKSMIGADEAGIYSLAYSISQIMTLFNQALLQTITPWIYKKIKDDRTEEIAKVAYTSLTVIALVNLMLILFAPEAVAIFAPESYYEAIWVIPPVAMSVYFIFSYSLFATFEFYFEKTRLIALASVAGALLNVVLNFIFIRKYGYYAAGYTTLVCYAVYAICHYLFMKQICVSKLGNQRVYDERILLVLSASFVLIGFVLMLMYPYAAIRYAVVLLVLVLGIGKRRLLIQKVKILISIRNRK